MGSKTIQGAGAREPTEESAVLVYDGECPVCAKAAGWVRDRSLPGTFELFSCRSEELGARFPFLEKDACLRAMHLVLPGGEVLAGERAVPEILRRIPGYRRLAALFRLPGAKILSRAFYRGFAANRHRFSRR